MRGLGLITGLRLGRRPPLTPNAASIPTYYLRPDGVSKYLRPDGVSLYRRT